MKTMLLSIIFMFVLIVTALFGGDKDKSASVIIDVRSEAEWNTGHLEGAMLIPYDRIAQEITKVVDDKKTIIYLYCRSGRRSGIALNDLKKAGYEDLINLGTVEDASKKLNKQIVK